MLSKIKIVLCLGSSCFARGNQELISSIRKFIARHQLEDKVEFKGDHCFANCNQGPNLKIGSKLISNVSDQNIDLVLEEALNQIL